MNEWHRMSQQLKAAGLVAAFLGIPVVTAIQRRKSDDSK